MTLSTAIRSARKACEAMRRPLVVTCEPFDGGAWLVLDAHGLRLEFDVKPLASAETIGRDLEAAMGRVGK